MLYLDDMVKNSKYNLSVFFILLFVVIISAPSIILSFDNSVDVTTFYSINEEEENQHFKLDFKKNAEDYGVFVDSQSMHLCIAYPFKTYSNPNLNLISPPPDFVS